MVDKNDNLLKGNPETMFKSGRNAAENGRKGGLKSGEAYKKKKELKERIELALELFTAKHIDEANNEQEAMLIELLGIDVYTYMKASFDVLSDAKTTMHGIQGIWDRTEGKPQQPKQAIEHSGNIGGAVVVPQGVSSAEEWEKEHGGSDKN